LEDEAEMNSTMQTLGKYRIVKELGRGGFGTVYLAEDTSLDNRPVALKVLHPQLLVDPDTIQLFGREAGVGAKLDHRHIVTVHEAGDVGGTRFIAMQYVPGRSLREVIKGEDPQPLERVAKWLEQVASALDYAHGEGVLHRDIKPSNILLDREGRAMLTDFGLAKAVEHSGGSMSSKDKEIMTGTAKYMAPEQAKGKPVPQSDIYSLGVVVYELLTAKVPFEGDDPFAIAIRHMTEEPVSPREHRPELSEPVEAAVLKAMAKQPAARFVTAGEMAGAFRLAVEAEARATERARQRKRERELEAAREAEEQRKRQQVELARLYEAAQRAVRAQNLETALARCKDIEHLQPGYGDVALIKAQAEARLREQREAEEQERRRKAQVGELYEEAVRLLKRRKYQQALDRMAKLHRLEPTYPDSQRVEQRAREGLVKPSKPVSRRRAWVVRIMTLLTLVVGSMLMGWFVIGWAIWPVKWSDVDPVDLRQEARDEYLVMVANDYATTRDAAVALPRLGSWPSLAEADREIRELADYQAVQGQRDLAQRLRTLADGLPLPATYTEPEPLSLQSSDFFLSLVFTGTVILAPIGTVGAAMVLLRWLKPEVPHSR